MRRVSMIFVGFLTNFEKGFFVQTYQQLKIYVNTLTQWYSYTNPVC